MTQKHENFMPFARILAASDTLFRPLRRFDGTRGSVIYARRMAFRNGGVAWSASRFGALSEEATRNSVSRWLASSKLDRLLSIKTGTSRALSVKLTPEGDATMRAMCNLPSLRDALPLLQRLLDGRINPEGYDVDGKAWLRETMIAGCEYAIGDYRDRIIHLQEAMLPLLVNGLAASNADVQGHAWYAPLVDAMPILPPANDVQAIEELEDAYWDARDVEQQALASAKADAVERRDIGDIPLPVCPIRRGYVAAIA